MKKIVKEMEKIKRAGNGEVKKGVKSLKIKAAKAKSL